MKLRASHVAYLWDMVNGLLWAAVIMGLAGCATTGGIDEFNYTMNKSRPGCNQAGAGVCHTLYPSRAEIAAANRLECTGYVMAKAYALAAQGVKPDRMSVAGFRLGQTSHAVLVLDEEIALDNLSDYAAPFSDYMRFDPILINVPWRI